MGEKLNKYTKNKFTSVWAVLILDTCISLIASALGVLFVRWQTAPIFNFQFYLIGWLAASAMCSVASFAALGTYKIVIRHSSFRSIGRLALAVLLKTALLGLLLWILPFHFPDQRTAVFILLADLTVTLLMMIITRVIIISILENLRNDNVEENVGKLGVMIYGTGNKSVGLLDRLENSTHYNVLGFLTHNKSKKGQIVRDFKAYYCENEEELGELRNRLGIECLLFAADAEIEDDNSIIQMCINQGISILNTPKIEQMRFGSMSQEAVKTISRKTDDYIPDGMNAFERNVKRIIDCVVAGILLLIFSPLFLICFIAIKLSDGGPAIYRQERIGRFGRPFNIYKFRSMRTDAESDGPALYSGDEDPRLTKVGKFLRQHHLDELPQLWNVFKGDMAFIGYRPERKFYIDQIMEADPRYYYLYQIRPGVTSYATLYNGYTDTLEKMLRRLEYDLYYLRHRSWWFDIKILFLTFANIVFGKKF